MFTLFTYNIVFGVLFFWSVIFEISTVKLFSKAKSLSKVILFLSIVLGILFGLRDISFGSDTPRYMDFLVSLRDIDTLSWYNDSGFFVLISLLRAFLSVNVASIALSSLIAYLYLDSYRKITGDNSLYLVVLVLSFFWFVDLNSNILKSGLAYGLLLSALANPNRKRLFFVAAFMCHSSSIIFILLYVIEGLLKTRLLFLLWLLCNIISYLDLGLYQMFFSVLYYINPQYTELLNITHLISTEDYQTGYRLDFSLYSFLAIIPFVKNVWLKRNDYYLLNLFLLLNSLFVLLYDVPYSNRIGLLSYVLLPIMYTQVLDMNKSVKRIIYPIMISLSFLISQIILN